MQASLREDDRRVLKFRVVTIFRIFTITTM